MNEPVFGIDLGTTYSAIAMINDFGQAEVIHNREGDTTTPSVVYFENESNFVVGKEAKNGILLHPDTTVALIKRHMGESFTLDFFGSTFTPESISAVILKDLVDAARDETGIDTNRVVITVPAYFGLAEKAATRQAGEIAGLEVVGIVTEPVAAALSVGLGGETQKTVFVYDLGGGTFDCTIMRMSPELVDVVAIDGNRMLGGADWDARLFELINDKFMSQASLDEDPTSDEDFAQRLMTSVEDVKKTLSRRERASVTLSYGDALEKVEISRAEFETATKTLVDETIEIVKRTVAAAEAKHPGIALDEVVLVGGSSRMPMIEESLVRELGWQLRASERDLAVAKGAAIYGNGDLTWTDDETVGDIDPSRGAEVESPLADRGLASTPRRPEVHNVLSRGLGVRFVRSNPDFPDGWEPYIDFSAHANDSLPLDVAFEGHTIEDGTTALEIHIYEQNSGEEDPRPGSNREVTPDEGAVLTDLPSLPAHTKILFELHIDTEGESTLTAFEPTSGRRTRMTTSLSVLQAEDLAVAKELVSAMVRSV
jgi:molecular chaperone DnaK